jgi:universal stress protein A
MASYRKILVLLDLLDGSTQVAAAAMGMAAHSNGEIVALHVVEFIPVEPMGEALMPTVQLQADLASRARERIAALTRSVGMERTRCRVEVGNTKLQIMRVAAEEAADLIVLGSRERHGLAILVNFTEDTVLHAAHCDILAVRLK